MNSWTPERVGTLILLVVFIAVGLRWLGII